MFYNILIVLLYSATVSSQINGEFWWLNEKVAKLQQVEAPPPRFDDVNELETDESIKVVLKENKINSLEESDYGKNKRISPKADEKQATIYFRDQSEISMPTYTNEDNIMKSISKDEKSVEKVSSVSSLAKNKSQDGGDELVFVFPVNNEILWEDNKKNSNSNSIFFKDLNVTSYSNNYTAINKSLNNRVWFDEESTQPESESICKFISKQECIRGNGILHTPDSCPKIRIPDTQKICCIFPLASRTSTKILHSNNNYYRFIKRDKRSDPIEKVDAALKQRNTLLERNNNLKIQSSKLTATTVRSKPAHKIATPEYIDPYWNIKNTKFRSPGLQSSGNTDYQNTKYDYSNQEYVEDYAVEIPKPGFIGLYSDHENSRGHTSWKSKITSKGGYYGGTDEVSEEEEDDESDVPFGYSTFDPRLGNRPSTDTPKAIKRKPQRLTTTIRSDNVVKNSDSQTINFHSTPDFHVLQGFKLVNLGDNKNRYVRKTTTEYFYDNEDSNLDTSTSVLVNSNEDYIDGIDLDQQVFKTCGKVLQKPGKDVTDGRCDPWLAIVVFTKNSQSILCYATIIHPRAAVTAADCVHGKTPGEVSIITGVWDLKAEKGDSQNRMAVVYTHLNYKPGELANDLALMYWKRPLSLGPNVQPVCLADPHVGDDCYFAGWGGYDQALQPHPHWQHATILTPRKCNDKVSAPDVDIPVGAFCASVRTRGTVTGVGGPLLCKSGDRVSIVGVSVYRENIVLLLPAFDWIISVMGELQIN